MGRSGRCTPKKSQQVTSTREPGPPFLGTQMGEKGAGQHLGASPEGSLAGEEGTRRAGPRTAGRRVKSTGRGKVRPDRKSVV